MHHVCLKQMFSAGIYGCHNLGGGRVCFWHLVGERQTGSYSSFELNGYMTYGTVNYEPEVGTSRSTCPFATFLSSDNTKWQCSHIVEVLSVSAGHQVTCSAIP